MSERYEKRTDTAVVVYNSKSTCALTRMRWAVKSPLLADNKKINEDRHLLGESSLTELERKENNE